jgi:hypothetical protein
VLFSHDEIAQFINRNFEPVWESVRPVPILRLDFGNGQVVTRTLHGNIATYVCTPNGEVLDVLPGIYTPSAYRRELDQFRLLANYVAQEGEEVGKARLGDYHETRLAALRKQEPPPFFFNAADIGKRLIEGGIKAILVKSSPPRQDAPAPASEPGPALSNREDLGNWAALAKDTAANETARRQQIHEQLARQGAVRPERLTKWLYKEVLHADLDDPYLGLGPVLFDRYVFETEERKDPS